MRRIRWTVGLKIGATVLIFAGALVAMQMKLNDPERLLVEQKHLEANRLGRLIVSIVAKEMEEEEPWRVQEHLRLANSPGDIYEVRVIDQNSVARYTLHERDLGREFDREVDEPCRRCHADGSDAPEFLLWTAVDGTQIFSHHYAVRNEVSCRNCHEGSRELLGKVLLDLQVTEPDLELLELNQRMAGIGTLLAIAVLLAILVATRLIVSRPLGRLVAATQDIEGGRFDLELSPANSDEIGELGLAFQRMAKRLGELISEQKQVIDETTDELEQTQQQVLHQEKMAALGRLTAGVAHEVGNPLAAISATVQLIMRTTEEPESRQRAGELLEHVHRVSSVVRELGELYRPSRTAKELVDVRRTVEAALQVARFDRGLRKIDVDLIADPKCPPAWVIEDQLLQVLLNLIFNAVDAMPDGGVLRLSCAARNEWVEILIEDTGCGIPAGDMKAVFDPFFTTKPVGKGTGLGLWVSWSLVHRWGGEINIESEAQKGTKVLVRVPQEPGNSNRTVEPT